MVKETLKKYIHKFSTLHVDRSKGAVAPHKPILRLSIISEIEKGNIAGNKIYITPELVAQFKDYWTQLIHTSQFTPNFALPFYHLKSEGFWFLHTFIGKEIALTSSHSIKSFGHLKDVVDFASFDEALYELLLSANHRELLRSTLLHVYFHDAHISNDNKIIAEISNR